jgi:hypothetical protein
LSTQTVADTGFGERGDTQHFTLKFTVNFKGVSKFQITRSQYQHESFYTSHQISTKNLYSFRRYRVRAEGNFGFKVKGHIDTNVLRETPLSPDTSSHQISMKNLHSFRRYRAEGNYNAILGQGHWVKIKGRIDTDLLRDTPLSCLSPDTSSHQNINQKSSFISKTLSHSGWAYTGLQLHNLGYSLYFQNLGFFCRDRHNSCNLGFFIRDFPQKYPPNQLFHAHTLKLAACL